MSTCDHLLIKKYVLCPTCVLGIGDSWVNDSDMIYTYNLLEKAGIFQQCEVWPIKVNMEASTRKKWLNAYAFPSA